MLGARCHWISRSQIVPSRSRQWRRFTKLTPPKTMVARSQRPRRSGPGALQLADGRLLTWSNDDTTARLWAADGAPGPVLQGHIGEVFGALQLADATCLPGALTRPRGCGLPTAPRARSCSGSGARQLADGRLLTWSDDTTARLWAADGVPGPAPQGHTDQVRARCSLPTGACSRGAMTRRRGCGPPTAPRAGPAGPYRFCQGRAATARRPPAHLERRQDGAAVALREACSRGPTTILRNVPVIPAESCSHYVEPDETCAALKAPR